MEPTETDSTPDATIKRVFVQIFPGEYALIQNGAEVGRVVVTGTAPGPATENWYLYQGNGLPAGKATYTWPSPQSPSVTTKYTLLGGIPAGFTAIQYGKALKAQGITYDYVNADCMFDPNI